MNDADRARLDELSERLEGLTPGPWTSFSDDVEDGSGDSFIRTGGKNIYVTGASEADRDFIADARQDVPWLVELVTQRPDKMAPEPAGNARAKAASVSSRKSLLSGVLLGVLAMLLADAALAAAGAFGPGFGLHGKLAVVPSQDRIAPSAPVRSGPVDDPDRTPEPLPLIADPHPVSPADPNQHP